jgi:hypothetical protein
MRMTSGGNRNPANPEAGGWPGRIRWRRFTSAASFNYGPGMMPNGSRHVRAQRNSAVTGQHRRGLGSQELTPCRPNSLWGRVQVMTLEDVPDACRCQVDAQDGQLPMDPAIAPGRVLSGQANYELHSSGGDLRATRGLRVGPLATDQLTMPTKQGIGLHKEPMELPSR